MARKRKSEAIKIESGIAAGIPVYVRPVADCPVYYSNLAQITTSGSEVRIVLSQIMYAEPGGNELEVTTPKALNPQVVLYMSHAHANNIAKILTGQIEKHLKQNKQATK